MSTFEVDNIVYINRECKDHSFTIRWFHSASPGGRRYIFQCKVCGETIGRGMGPKAAVAAGINVENAKVLERSTWKTRAMRSTYIQELKEKRKEVLQEKKKKKRKPSQYTNARIDKGPFKTNEKVVQEIIALFNDGIRPLSIAVRLKLKARFVVKVLGDEGLLTDEYFKGLELEANQFFKR